MSSLPCPECGEPIPVSIPELVARGTLDCGGCGLVLEVDRQRSARSFELLRELDEGQRQARAVQGARGS